MARLLQERTVTKSGNSRIKRCLALSCSSKKQMSPPKIFFWTFSCHNFFQSFVIFFCWSFSFFYKHNFCRHLNMFQVTNEYWLINKEYKISGCLIPKCGSSTLRRLFFQMSGARDWNDPNMPESRIHALSLNLKRNYYSRKRPSTVLTPAYKLFTFTREPFARIVSYYHSKILKMHPFYYKSIIRKVLIQQEKVKNAPVDAQKAAAMGLRATFKGLVKYIVSFTGKDDVHWAPMCNLCQFCSYNYTFFGKLENAAEDFPRLMRYLGFNEDQTPVHTFSTLNASRQTVIDHFKDIERSDVEKLQQKYIKDYQLLNYPLPTSYLPQFRP